MLGPLVDTDMLSEVFKGRNEAVRSNSLDYLTEFGSFRYSVITHYEILLGLRLRDASVQLATYNQLATQSVIVFVDSDIADKAAGICASLRGQGKDIGDKDCLIAATALSLGQPLVTGNESHFSRVPDLEIINWRQA